MDVPACLMLHSCLQLCPVTASGAASNPSCGVEGNWDVVHAHASNKQEYCSCSNCGHVCALARSAPQNAVHKCATAEHTSNPQPARLAAWPVLKRGKNCVSQVQEQAGVCACMCIITCTPKNQWRYARGRQVQVCGVPEQPQVGAASATSAGEAAEFIRQAAYGSQQHPSNNKRVCHGMGRLRGHTDSPHTLRTQVTVCRHNPKQALLKLGDSPTLRTQPVQCVLAETASECVNPAGSNCTLPCWQLHDDSMHLNCPTHNTAVCCSSNTRQSMLVSQCVSPTGTSQPTVAYIHSPQGQVCQGCSAAVRADTAPSSGASHVDNITG